MRTVTFFLSLILIFVIPMETLVQYPGFGSLARASGLLVAVFWSVTVIGAGRIRRPSQVHLMIMVFFFWNAISMLWSLDGQRTVERMQTYFQLLVMVLIIWDLYDTPAALKAGLQAYVLGAYVSIGGTIYNYLNATAFVYGRYSTAGMHVVDLGLILALGIPIAWYLAVAGGFKTKLAQGLRIVNFGYLPAACMGIALTGSRAALIAALPAFLFALVSLNQLRPYARVLVFLGVVALLFLVQDMVPPSSLQRLATIHTEFTQGGNLSGRTYIWREGFTLFAERPLLGIGSNAYKTTVELGQIAHNTFLSVLVELGIVGFGLFGIILTMVVYQATRQPKLESRLWLTIILVWALGASTLTWEHRKGTWLFVSFVLVSAGLSVQRNKIGNQNKMVY